MYFSQRGYRYSTNMNVYTVQHINTYIQALLAFNTSMWGSSLSTFCQKTAPGWISYMYINSNQGASTLGSYATSEALRNVLPWCIQLKFSTNEFHYYNVLESCSQVLSAWEKGWEWDYTSSLTWMKTGLSLRAADLLMFLIPHCNNNKTTLEN